MDGMDLNHRLESYWNEYCTQCLTAASPREYIPWSLEHLQIPNLINDGIAILNTFQEILWCNSQFKRWFPKSEQLTPGLNVIGAMESPIFLNEEEEDPAFNPNPLTSYLLSGQSAKGIMQTRDGHIFEVEVHRWECPRSDEEFMMIQVHNATERRELNRKLMNLHNMCELFSHVETLKEKSRSERDHFLNDGIQYMAKCLFHYEFLEVRRYDAKTNTLPIYTHYGLLKEAAARTMKAEETGNGTIGFVAVERKAYICRDTETDPYYLRGGETARSSLTVPIIFQEELLGILNAESSRPDAFDENDLLYAEIFAHEIALAMNFVRILDTEMEVGRQTSAEEIHGKVALPIKQILNLCMTLYSHLDEQQVEAQHALYQIIQNAQNVSQIIRNVGKNLAPTDLVAPPDRREIVEKWFKAFSGKRILLVDPSEELFHQGEELFQLLNCTLDWAENGEIALKKISHEWETEGGYFAILSTIKPPGFQRATQFFINLAASYGRKHPPLVLLQDIGFYDPDHTIVAVRTRYSGSGLTGKPFIENRLLEMIDRTVHKVEITEPCFIELGNAYNDPYVERIAPVESTHKAQ